MSYIPGSAILWFDNMRYAAEVLEKEYKKVVRMPTDKLSGPVRSFASTGALLRRQNLRKRHPRTPPGRAQQESFRHDTSHDFVAHKTPAIIQ
ncbi:MAG: hypothetical protein U5L09_09725 [Bacteroidales bacterium]|nr:hypothetical protein [Bacteroidales bacterium]